MKAVFAVPVIALMSVSPALADERPGDAALGALSGALVFGPVGLLAGAVVGYTAGPSISQSWRKNRRYPRNAVRAPRRAERVAAGQRGAGAPRVTKPAAGTVAPQAPAPGAGGPPVQGLE